MSLTYHPPGEPHAEAIAGAPVSSFNVEIGGGSFRRASEAASILDQPAEFHGGELARLGLRLFDEFRNKDPDSALAIESLTFEILDACSRFENPGCYRIPPRWLEDARNLLDFRFREAITVRGIAREARVHPVHFAAAFRRQYNSSVGEYVRRRRLEYVRCKLRDSDLSLAEIALEAGFADQSHMTRTFKRFVGRTPGEYRTLLPFKTER